MLALADQVTRLADLLPEAPPPAALLVRLLAALTREHHRLEVGDTAGLCRDLNGAWLHRHVHVTLAGGQGAINGHLEGIDPHGSLLLSKVPPAKCACCPPTGSNCSAKSF